MIPPPEEHNVTEYGQVVKHPRLKHAAGIAVGVTAGVALTVGVPMTLMIWGVPSWVPMTITVLCLAAWAFRDAVSK